MLKWQGILNRLSPSSRTWEGINEVAKASRKQPLQPYYYPRYPAAENGVSFPPFNGSFRRIIRQRWSAVAMDGISSMPVASFYALLERTVSREKVPPFPLFPWPSCVDLVLFVHRVDGLLPGLSCSATGATWTNCGSCSIGNSSGKGPLPARKG
ncbi:MAG: hypothetical protein PHD01_04595 [Geobacteraceae bacterium]|nr:hypothetical protein [Geobacteraceae bacterium]